MTIIKHIRQLFIKKSVSPDAGHPGAAVSTVPDVPTYQPWFPVQPITSGSLGSQTTEALPHWLADEEALRDEGVLFGLSAARPDEKTALIRAYFSRQIAPLDESIDEQSERIGELNLFIEQRENRILALRDRLDDLRESQPSDHTLVRTIASLLLSACICISNFYLIDETLRPVFPNHWIALGVFMAGMFNLFSRRSFFFDEGSRLTGRRLVAEMGLPLTASVFVLAQALQIQSVVQATALFAFVLFLFLLAGNLLLSTLNSLQTDLTITKANRRLAVHKAQHIPAWEAEIDKLTRDVDTIRTQKWPIVTALNHTQTERTRLNTRRDELINLFLSEFELARSLRDKLTEQQRKQMMNYD